MLIPKGLLLVQKTSCNKDLPCESTCTTLLADDLDFRDLRFSRILYWIIVERRTSQLRASRLYQVLVNGFAKDISRIVFIWLLFSNSNSLTLIAMYQSREI